MHYPRSVVVRVRFSVGAPRNKLVRESVTIRMTNDDMIELSKALHEIDDLYQLYWLKEYLEARIARLEMNGHVQCSGCKKCWQTIP